MRSPLGRVLLALGMTLALLGPATALGANGLTTTARFRAGVSGSPAKVVILLGSGRARAVVIGIRHNAAGRPGSLLASGTLESPRAGSWNTVSVGSGVIVAGNSYWLTVSPRHGSVSWHVGRGAGCAERAEVQVRMDAVPSRASLARDRAKGSCAVRAYVILAAAEASPLGAVFPPSPATSLATFASNHGVEEESSTPLTAPVNTVAPAVTGTTTEGFSLEASEGSWAEKPTSFAYRWQRCESSGANCAAINGATSSGYTLKRADVGHRVQVLVTAANSVGATATASATTAVVVASPVGAPVNTTAPAISGSTIEGATLKTSNGTWSNSPTSFAYQWQDCDSAGVNCAAIAGATSVTYVLKAADVAHTLRVLVTATNAHGSAQIGSAQTGLVTAVASPPVNTEVPRLSGSPVEGETLNTTNGVWTNTPTSFTYRWQDCNSAGAGCVTVSGATAASYALKASDVGHTMRAVVTAKNAGGTASATSAQSGTVIAAPEEEPGGGAELFISPSGKDSNACTEAAPCLTMGHAFEKASAGATVRMLSGSYPAQTIQGSEKGGAHVVFEPAAAASVTVGGTILVVASHITVKGLSVQDVIVGNFNETPGRPNPTDVLLLNLTGRNFEIASATHVTVEGGSWGPASACGGPDGGGNNSIREPIPGVAPENILINNTVIHDVQSYNLVECHIEGLAIFAGNHVTVKNSRFYDNSIYDVFIQANSGGSPENVTIEGNWMADATDNSGANGHSVGFHDGIAFGSEIDSNLSLIANHFNGVVNIDDDGSIATYTNTSMVDNFGEMTYTNYPCASTLKGVTWNKNVWQNDKCGSSDVDLSGAAYPYQNATDDSSMNYTLTGAYANWPEEAGGAGAGELFVSTTGSDGGSCTELAPCKSLARAYSVAVAGATVQVGAGSYGDTSLPLTAGKTSATPVVFEPASGASVSFSKLVNVEARGVELKGFTFERELYFGETAEDDVARNNALHNFEIVATGAKAPRNISIIGGTAGPVADGSDNENNLIATNGPETTAVPTKITIEGVLIHEFTKVGSAHVDCLQIWAGNELMISGNTFRRCSIFDIFLQSLPNGTAGTPKNVTIQNNFLEKTIEGFYSIFLPRHNEGNPEHFENLEIRNNSATQAISADPRATYTNAKFDGNIAPAIVFWNEATEVDQSPPAGAEADYNVFYGAGAAKLGAHDQTAAAGFVNEGAMNLNLLAGAAAIEHGDPSDFPARDINGAARTSPPDAGASQFAG